MVGVIGALAVFVAEHAAFDGGDPDWLVIVAATVSFAAVVRYRVGVVTVVASCAAVGLLRASGARLALGSLHDFRAGVVVSEGRC